jgi:hypothetical protein
MEKATGKYIYCIIRKPRFFDADFCGVDGSEIRCVDFGNLSAVVSDAEVKDYPITRENTITHQRVIEEIMRNYSPVLPASFGTVAENSDVIKEKILEAKQDELLDALGDIAGKIEVNLKAIWLDMPSIFQKVVSENPELKLRKKALPDRRISRDEAIEIGKLVAAGVESRREKIKEAVLCLLKNIISDYKETPLFGEEMIFNLAFLIPEKKQKAFDVIVRDLDDRYSDENIYFKYVGSIPPFNFVKVPISLS